MTGDIQKAYFQAKDEYAAYGVDVEKALRIVSEHPLSIHCWQGDDLQGFESRDSSLNGGLAVTGNYPGKPRNPEELREDLEKALSYIPGKKKVNLHACYSEGTSDRNELQPSDFDGWIDWGKEKNLGLDFNPTFFSHPKSELGYTLSSEDKAVRDFWTEHGIKSERIAEYIGKKLGTPCINNIWIPDGEKEMPADTLAPRLRLKESLDKIFCTERLHHISALESKLFGIGSEAYVTGSHEFYMGYVMENPSILLTLDTGHFHPTEKVSSKISSLLSFLPGLLLHISRPERWDSDHVVSFDDETRAVMRELVRCEALEKVFVATDYFDASINRIAALAIGARNVRKALLYALLEPVSQLKKAETSGDKTARLLLTEEAKTLPFGIVWEYLCEQSEIPCGQMFLDDIKAYESNVLAKR